MKILAIRIKNLASLEGVTEIDFTQEPLASAGIFAITGPTGAGKSTVLDALCLALYGKTPRYLQAKESGIEIADVQGNAISQGDVRGILRDGTSDGFAEVDFAAVDGQRYSATWRVRRARDKVDGSLQAFTIALKNIDTNLGIPGKKTELQEAIERLVGLNFEQFTRSVLLAQGDFTAFLEAARDEKSALLEKLTGTHIYSEISKQIFSNYRENERALEDLNLQREGIATLTNEELQEFQLQKTTLDQTIATQEKEVALINKEITWHTQLAILQSNLTSSHTALEQAKEFKQHAIGREQQLRKVEQVQSTRTWVDSEQIAQRQLAEKELTLQQLQTTLQSLQKRKEEVEIALQKASDDVVGKMQKQEEAIPLLEEAKALDIQIREKTEQLNLAEKEVNGADAQNKQLDQKIQEQQQQVDQLSITIKQLQQWKTENNPRQPIAENRDIINSKLSDAETLLTAVKLSASQLDITQGNIDHTTNKKIEFEEKAAVVTQSLQTEQANHKTASESLAAIPIAALENEKAVIDLSMGDIISAEAHWKLLFNSQTELDLLKQKLDHNKIELETKTQLLTQTVDQLVVVTATRDVSLRMLNQARLAATENVESLRSLLTSEDPCPVCGSTEHPYAIQHPQLDHVLQQLEAAHKQNESAYTTCLTAESTLRQTGIQLKEAIRMQEVELNKKGIALSTYQVTWANFSIYSNAMNVPDDQRTEWLGQQFQETKAKQKDLQSQLQSYTLKKQEVDKLQNKVTDLGQQRDVTTNALKDTARSLQSLQEQFAQHQKEQENNSKTLAEIEQNLSVYFKAQGWFSHWKIDPPSFLQRINDFADQWKINHQKLEEDSQRQAVLSATLSANQEQSQSLSTDLQKKQNVFEGLKAQQDFIMQKRKAIFNGEAASTIESSLKLAVTAAQQEVEKAKAVRDQIQTDLTRTGTQAEADEKELSKLQLQADSFAQRIQTWLSEFNERNSLAVDRTKLEELLSFDQDWIESERAALRAIDDAITQAQSVLQERAAQLQQHEQQRLSERSAEQVNEFLNVAKEGLQAQVQEKNEIGFRLQQDQDNKQKIGELLGVIEAKGLVVENWAKLNEIIGSADGKKFRQIAQEYTLDVLLGYANVHLKMLNKRYLLKRVPNTLGLLVLDQDMGDEVRTVFSLSGGESFLVSLALALGLASLSSSRMQVESLFIDEGFGSLDPATLNIAMDALERLHNQGRKVGVISHVQEMTERIPVQIKVSKENSGRSKVEIV